MAGVGKRDDLVIDTRALGRRPGSMLPYQAAVTSPSRIGLEMIAILPDTPIDLDLRLEAVSEGILVSGTVRTNVTGECIRCLETFEDDLVIEPQELFAYPDSLTVETTEDDEIRRVERDRIDLEPMLVDAAAAVLPFQPVCSPDCLGLCSECGIRLAITEPGHGHETIDPRWAALAEKAISEGTDSGS